MKQPWMIQVQVDDKDATAFSALELKRKLKGTGVEVDMCYAPVRVSPGRFVGRGSATEGARLKATKGNVLLFKPLNVADARSPESTALVPPIV
jgi:hypothetical protein